MSQSLLVSIVVGVVSGAAGAGAVVLLSKSEAPEPAVELLTPADSALEESISALRADNEALRERLDALELARPDLRTTAAPTELDEARAVKEELQELVTKLQQPGTVLPDQLQAGVTEAVSALREQEEREREERRQAAQAERLEEQLADLASKLELDNYQLGEMRTALQTSNEKRNKAFAAARESGSFGNMRETMRTLRQETDEALEKFLTPTQLSQYEELREEERGGRGGFPGRGDDGGRADRGRRSDGF